MTRDELDQKVKEAKFDNWVTLFKFKNDWALNPELPVVTPWKTVTPINTPTWVLERNPYSIWVDTAGNQLPYIDKVVMTLAETWRCSICGPLPGSTTCRNDTSICSKLPVFLENQQKGGYKLYLDPGDYGGDMIIKFNLSYEADPEIANG